MARTPDHLDVIWIGTDGALGSTNWIRRAQPNGTLATRNATQSDEPTTP